MTKEPANRPTEPYRILLVEDALDQAHLIQFLLEEEGRSRVTVIQDGLRGCRYARDRDWDLVICDINLPGADGLQVMRTSRESHPETPVLATTAYTNPEYANQALRSGADEFLQKPIEREELREKVFSLLERGGKKEQRERADRAEEVRFQRERAAESAAERDANSVAPWEWEDARGGARPGQILAVGTRPGDVEAGCGGALISHRARGAMITILTLVGRHGAPAERKSEAKRAGRRLGARLVSGNIVADAPGAQRKMASLIEGVVNEVRPEIIYTHSPHDNSRENRMAHLATLSAAEDVPAIYGYQTESSTVEFQPALFVDISEHLEAKLGVLSEYDFEVDEPLRPDPAEVEVTARYWGRFSGHARAEPLEVIRGPEPADAVHRHPLESR